jgi:hypothetical protein
MEQSEQEKLRRMNAKGEFIYRNHDEHLYPIENPKHRVRDKYPWEGAFIGSLRKINKEFFRCKGNHLNPVHIDRVSADGMQHKFDCSGRHSLPIRNDKEFIYPILIEMLNYVQEKLNKKVVITCGHRCPLHNRSGFLCPRHGAETRRSFKAALSVLQRLSPLPRKKGISRFCPL